MIDDDNQLWVGVTISRPGRHNFVIRYEEDTFTDGADSQHLSLVQRFTSLDSTGRRLIEQTTVGGDREKETRTKYSFHRCIIQAREEEVPPFSKEPKSLDHVRTFQKEFSVFKDWREDNDQVLSNCFNADFGYTKIEKKMITKDQDDLENTRKVLRQNFEKIKKIFITVASQSNFPTITWNKFSEFAIKA